MIEAKAADGSLSSFFALRSVVGVEKSNFLMSGIYSKKHCHSSTLVPALVILHAFGLCQCTGSWVAQNLA